MKRVIVVSLLAILMVAASVSATSIPAQPSWWTGHNAALKDYYVQPGYPPYEEHARYIGDLKGTWMEMGIQYGERAGDLIRMVFEGYWDQMFASIKNQEKLLSDARNFGRYLAQLTPEAVEFMQGIAKGAAPELAKSTYAKIGNDYDKILIINHYFACRRTTYTQYKWPGTVAAMPVDMALVEESELPACSGVVVIGKLDGPTKDRTTIHGGTRDQVFFPQLYEVTYTTSPSDPNANRIWTIASAGEIGGQMVGNDKGVIVTGYAGGNAKSIFAFGIEWNIGCWYGASFADTAQEAADILTKGRPGFIEKTGNKMVQPAWGINWLISDLTDAKVVETVPGRYAVRSIGDFGEENFLVCTNHCTATWSYDDNHVRSTIPMVDYGPETGSYSGLSVSGTRYWTQFWNVKYNYGKIDVNMVIDWYRGHYYISKDGVRVDNIWDNTYGWVPANLKSASVCRHQSGVPDTMKGTTTDAKVGVAQNLAFYFTKGRGHDWEGPWDLLSLKNIP